MEMEIGMDDVEMLSAGTGEFKMPEMDGTTNLFNTVSK